MYSVQIKEEGNILPMLRFKPQKITAVQSLPLKKITKGRNGD
jgi:hypothetical protein